LHHSRGSLVTALWGTGGLAWLLVIAAAYLGRWHRSFPPRPNVRPRPAAPLARH